MPSQAGKQTIAIDILPNISKSTGNQAMKFGQLTEYTVTLEIFFFKIIQETGRLVPGLFFIHAQY